MEPVGALSSQPATAADGPQYLTFRLGAEEYGVEILKVQEIKSYSPITPVPNTPRAVKGVMNLRRRIIPVVDLRLKFGMPETEYNRFAVVIVVAVSSNHVARVRYVDVLAVRTQPQKILRARFGPDIGAATANECRG